MVTAQRYRATHRSGARRCDGSVEAGDPETGVDLVADVDPDEERGDPLDHAARLQATRVDDPQSRDRAEQLRDGALVRLRIAADERVLVERVRGIRELVRAQRVQ